MIALPTSCDERQLSQNIKFSIYQSIFVPALTCGHEGVMTKTMRSQIQVAEIGFVIFSFLFSQGLGIELLLLCVERSQLRWFGHPVRIPPDHHLRHIQLGGPYGADSGEGEGIISLPWPGNASGSSSQSWLMWLGKGSPLLELLTSLTQL